MDETIWLEIGWDKNRRRIDALQDRLGVPEIERDGWVTAATLDAIRHFAHGIGDDNPRWRETDQRSPAVPPSFLYAVCPEANATRCPAADGWQWHGASWEWHAPVRIDTPIVVRTWVAAVDEAPQPDRGSVYTIVRRAEMKDKGGILLATVETRETSCLIGAGPPLRTASAPLTSWDLDDLVDIYSVFAGEAPFADVRAFAGVAVGDRLPRIAKGPITPSGSIAYLQGVGGLATADRIAWKAAQARPYDAPHNVIGVPETQDRIHWDGAFARHRGLPGASAPASARSCWLIQQVTDWMGEGAVLRAADCAILGMDGEGDALLIDGEIVERIERDGRRLVRIEQRATRRDGSTSATGSALVELP